MKKNLILMSLLFSSLLWSCKDDPKDEPLPDDVTEEEILEVCNLLELNSPEETISFNYTNDLISSIGFGYYSYDCTFDELSEEFVCDSALVNSQLKFTYSDSLITEAVVIEDGVTSEGALKLTYTEDQKLSVLSFTYTYDGATDVDEYRLVYNANGQVTKVENYDNYTLDGSFRLYGYESYKYSNDNVVEINYFYEDGNSEIGKRHKKLLPSKNPASKKLLTKGKMRSASRADLESTVTLTYDDKISPFYGSIPFLLYSNGFNFYFSKNNTLSYVEKEVGDNPDSYSIDYSYEYNDQDLPILVRFSSEEDGEVMTAEATYTYSCK